MTRVASFLCGKGYILRSGGAPGADQAFEAGVIDPERKEIYLPWRGFERNCSLRYRVSDEAISMAEGYHPAWEKLSLNGRLMMGRNMYQVLGEDLGTPSEFVVCWTSDGYATGGTGQAIRVAHDKGIPVFNLHNRIELEAVSRWLVMGKVVLNEKRMESWNLM